MPRHVEFFMISVVSAPQGATRQQSSSPANSDELATYVGATLAHMSSLDISDPRREQLRSDAICACLPMARRAAARFAGRGENVDDLVQVATIGLIKAVDRFDPAREIPFVNYAMPTIIGEIKRHFRDKTWSVRVSRSRQELYLEISRLMPTMAQELGRSPSVADIAERLGVSSDEVLAGIDCGQAYSARSLSAPIGDEDSASLADTLGEQDERLESAADREALREALAGLPAREREIVVLRFFANLTQSEIAERVGVSQMHVSRLLKRTLSDLRDQMFGEA